MPTNAARYDVLIAGAGIGGLVCGWRLAQQGKRVLIAEAADRVGGVIRTVEDSGYLLEKGPNSFSSSDEMMNVIAELGLRNRVLMREIRSTDRFIWRAGRLRRVPISPPQLLVSDVLPLVDK